MLQHPVLYLQLYLMKMTLHHHLQIYLMTPLEMFNSNHLSLSTGRSRTRISRPNEPGMTSRNHQLSTTSTCTTTTATCTTTTSTAPQPQHPSPHQPTFGPQRRQDQQPAPHSTTSPYGNKPSEDSAVMSHDVEVDLTSDNTHLPPGSPGWHFEDGYIVMDAVADEWQIKGNYLIRRHYLPRDHTGCMSCPCRTPW